MTLSDAIEGLYAAFAGYPGRPDMEACPCCVSSADTARLAGVALRDLTPEDIGHYAFKAITTWGSAADYKHFLPRILELAAAPGRACQTGLELWPIAGKLKYGDWTAWPAQERSAIETYVMALWEEILARYRPGDDGYDDRHFLADIEPAFDDLSPFLEKWATCREQPALHMLAEFVISELGDVLQGKGKWRDVAQREHVVRWFRDPARGKSLDRGIERHIDDPQAETLATGLNLWRSMTGHARG